MINRIYVVRHGEREDFIDPSWSETHERFFDPPLSAHGLDQAREVSEFFADKKIDMVFSSPLIRAIQTALPTTRVLGTKLCIEAGKKDALSIAEISSKFPGSIDTEYTPMWRPIENHEQMDEFLLRLKNVMGKFMEAEKAGKVHGDIAIFTHAAGAQGIAIALLDDPKYSFRCPVGGITVLKRDESTGGWALESPPSAAHLSCGAEYPWSFDDMKKF